MDGQIGGRLLGAGSYGCTFSPAPRCADGTEYKTVGGLPAVGKLAFRDDGELPIGQAIMKLPLASNYFALPSKTCRPALPLNDPDTCELLEDTDGSYVTMLIMPDGGATMDHYLHRPTAVADNFVQIFKHLLEGMIIYQDAGYIHNDIHSANVLVDKHNVARYIDFGRAYRPATINTLASAKISPVFNTKPSWRPPEVYLWKMLANRVSDGVRKIIDGNEDYSLLERLYPSRTSASVALNRIALVMKPLVGRDDFGAFARKYGTRMDSWRIGLMMWDAWGKIMLASSIPGSAMKSHPILKQSAKISHIIGGLTDFDVATRWDAKKALEHFR